MMIDLEEIAISPGFRGGGKRSIAATARIGGQEETAHL